MEDSVGVRDYALSWDHLPGDSRGVRKVPPYAFAAMRFLVAGLFLYGMMIARGEPSPSLREWTSAFILAVLIFVLDYGSLFWAERRVPSGVAAVMLATVPVFMALAEIVFLRTQRLTVRLALALLIGIGGVALLMSRSLNLGGAPIDRAGAMALILAAISFSLSRRARAQAAASILQNHEPGGRDARRRSVTGSGGGRAGGISRF